MTSDLGQRIADEVVGSFERLTLKSGKPVCRSNGVPEWTVLAGLVAVENGHIRVICLATGVKAMPDKVRKYSAGLVVHDMHAEVLCLRMFNWYLMEEVNGAQKRTLLEEAPCSNSRTATEGCKDTTGGKDVPVSESSKPLLRLKSSIQLALYVSEPPCGDASMSLVQGTQEPWEEHPAKRSKWERGRSCFGSVGAVRTKPGKSHSLVTYSKSCSDKLCVKQFTGILNAPASLCMEPVYLEFIVLDRKKHSDDDFARCFSTRLSEPPKHRLKVLTFDLNSYRFSRTQTAVPSPLSLIHCAITGTTQVLNNGVKNGSYVKNGPPKENGASMLCRKSLWAQARPSIPEFENYRDMKLANQGREMLKKRSRASLGSWPTSSEEKIPCLL